MSTNSIILLVFVIALVAVAVFMVATYFSRKRTKHLRDRFGPEYGRLAEASGSQSAAEKQLEEREKRAVKFPIHPLAEDERRRFTSKWQQVQAEFVDDPKDSLIHADDLLGAVMVARGYPVSDFEQRTADLSVDHPIVVQHYHAAHGIALAHRRGEATTEDMRQAMIHFRSLFDELVCGAARAHAAE